MSLLLSPSAAVLALLRPHTQSKSRIVRRKERTDGTIAWIVACMADAQADPTTESHHY
jgi:hypothetical protein